MHHSSLLFSVCSLLVFSPWTVTAFPEQGIWDYNLNQVQHLQIWKQHLILDNASFVL